MRAAPADVLEGRGPSSRGPRHSDRRWSLTAPRLREPGEASILEAMNPRTARFVADLLVARRPATDGVEWAEVEEVTVEYRLGGLARGLVESSDVPGSTALAWEAACREQALGARLLLEEWDDLRVVLDGHGIVPSLVKGGWMLVSGLYGSGERALDDIDVTVPANRATEAVELLTGAGWEPWATDALTTVGWAGAVTFHPRGPARAMGLAVDLHWNLEYGALRSRGAVARGRWGGRTLRPEDQLAIALEHVLKHLRFRTHLSGIADVARLLATPIDRSRVRQRLQAGPWSEAGSALLDAVDGWRATIDEGGRRAPHVQRRFALPRVVSRAGRETGRLAGLGARWSLMSPAAVVHELMDALFPPPAWLLDRYGSVSSETTRLRLHHLARVLRWSVGSGVSPLSTNQDQPASVAVKAL